MLKYNSKLIPRAKQLRKNMTKEENILWHDFLKSYPVKFYRQKVIDNYIADFYCHKAKLIIEIDGKQHLQTGNREHDKIRTAYFEALNLKTIRFMNSQLANNPNYVYKEIDKTVNERIAQLG